MSDDGLIGLCVAFNIANPSIKASLGTAAILRQMRVLAAHEVDATLPAPQHMAASKSMFSESQADADAANTRYPKTTLERLLVLWYLHHS